jgi:hypothetical protein
MPLSIVEGGTVIGPDLSEEEWADLKLRHKSGCVVVGPAGVSRREDPASRGTPYRRVRLPLLILQVL